MSILDLQSMPLLETTENGELRPSNLPTNRGGCAVDLVGPSVTCDDCPPSNLSVLLCD